ncbi:MAG TPA: hypothetical protein VHB27_14310 [Rhodopila sp.]|uniref:hypothetical protein n=1 Tax=Rhodopila sp. TaxID=2480087 RepID=UPI002CE0D78F|nr:hypothetical protein [Rhodopila sp.]HVY16395.1 hypothetical protein [Rhodopila sp.]
MDDLINKGVIVKPGRRAVPPGMAKGRTFLVSGTGRGGTTMVASLLHEAGLFLGDRLSDLVFEDSEVIEVLASRDLARLDALIARNNARHQDWGLKAPMLVGYLQARDLQRFRDPHLLIVFRDPVAIAVRHATAEHVSPLPVVREVAEASFGLACFAEDVSCPTLMLSYEKAISFPETVVDAVTRFCGFPDSAELRQRLLARVEPNAKAYINNARRMFQGTLDNVLGWNLHGWCWQSGFDEPVDVDIVLDNVKVATLRADRYREDLQAAGIGDGRHSFIVNLKQLGARAESMLTVRASGRTFELAKSRRPVASFPGFVP